MGSTQIFGCEVDSQHPSPEVPAVAMLSRCLSPEGWISYGSLAMTYLDLHAPG
ncbi:MAG: hypothetical protein ABW215_03985 [Kibdelosporangium sp.]